MLRVVQMTCKSISVLRSVHSLTRPLQLENLQAVEKEEVCGVYPCLQQLQPFLFHIPGNLREKSTALFLPCQCRLILCIQNTKARSCKGQVQLAGTVAWAGGRSLHRPQPEGQSWPTAISAIAAFGTCHETDQATPHNFHAGQAVILFNTTLTSIWVNSQEIRK